MTRDKKHELVRHLTLISTESYLMMVAKDEDKRIDCYNAVQDCIDAILIAIDDRQTSECPQLDALYSLTP